MFEVATAAPPGDDKSEALNCGYGVQPHASPAGTESPNAATIDSPVAAGLVLWEAQPVSVSTTARNPTVTANRLARTRRSGAGQGRSKRGRAAEPATSRVYACREPLQRSPRLYPGHRTRLSPGASVGRSVQIVLGRKPFGLLQLRHHRDRRHRRQLSPRARVCRQICEPAQYTALNCLPNLMPATAQAGGVDHALSRDHSPVPTFRPGHRRLQPGRRRHHDRPIVPVPAAGAPQPCRPDVA
jgi:hypothetical protein